MVECGGPRAQTISLESLSSIVRDISSFWSAARQADDTLVIGFRVLVRDTRRAPEEYVFSVVCRISVASRLQGVGFAFWRQSFEVRRVEFDA